MEIPFKDLATQLHFRFENTKNKLGLRILGDIKSFHQLYDLVTDCWYSEDIDMSATESCSYLGVITYFSYEVRHTFMGDRFVFLDGKLVKGWDDEIFTLFEEETDRFEVGVEFSWPNMLFIMASWWECLKHNDCPQRVIGIMEEFTENIEKLFQQRYKVQFKSIEPFIHGAIYAANPYLMLFMTHVNSNFFQWRSWFGNVPTSRLSEMMECASYGTYKYKDLMSSLKRESKKLNCPIENLSLDEDESIYDVKL